MSSTEINENNAIERPTESIQGLQKTSTDETTKNNVVAAESELKEDEIKIEVSDEDAITSPREKLKENPRFRQLKLYRAALRGDWSKAARTYEKYPEDISARITKQGDTALHVAAAANQTAFVRKLVNLKDEDLAVKNYVGNTAIHYAASHGNMEIAKVMIKKNEGLPMIRSKDGLLPLHMAALSGHEVMVRFLYRRTNHHQLDEKEKMDLLVASINADLYDFAWKLLKKYPGLACSRDSNGETALHALARKSETSFNFTDTSQQSIVGRLFKWYFALKLLKEYPDLAISRDRKGETALHALARKSETSSNFTDTSQQSIVGRLFKWYSRNEVVQTRFWKSLCLSDLVEQIWERVAVLDDWEISQLIRTPWRLTFVAAEKGNVEFLRILIRKYPDIILEVDDDGYSIFHIAVLYRQASVFRLIYDIGPLTDSIISLNDKKGNCILHLAAQLPTRNHLNVVPGAAEQMQQDLFWFTEVSKVARPSYAEAKNNRMKTPRELFVEYHKALQKEAQMWMKDRANSCMVVATLVTTVVFTAAFTIPGGNKEDTGAPNFLREDSFKIFFVADAISLVFSTISILFFLSIVTSTFEEKDFLRQLSKNLRLGFASLFMSIAAMMIAFCATCFIVLNGENPWIPILVASLASIPVLLFIRQYYRLFF